MHMQYFGGINTEATHKNSMDLPIYDTEGSYMASQTPIETETKIENMGIAVFNNDKLVRGINWYGISLSSFYNRRI